MIPWDHSEYIILIGVQPEAIKGVVDTSEIYMLIIPMCVVLIVLTYYILYVKFIKG